MTAFNSGAGNIIGRGTVSITVDDKDLPRQIQAWGNKFKAELDKQAKPLADTFNHSFAKAGIGADEFGQKFRRSIAASVAGLTHFAYLSENKFALVVQHATSMTSTIAAMGLVLGPLGVVIGAVGVALTVAFNVSKITDWVTGVTAAREEMARLSDSAFVAAKAVLSATAGRGGQIAESSRAIEALEKQRASRIAAISAPAPWYLHKIGQTAEPSDKIIDEMNERLGVMRQARNDLRKAEIKDRDPVTKFDLQFKQPLGEWREAQWGRSAAEARTKEIKDRSQKAFMETIEERKALNERNDAIRSQRGQERFGLFSDIVAAKQRDRADSVGRGFAGGLGSSGQGMASSLRFARGGNVIAPAAVSEADKPPTKLQVAKLIMIAEDFKRLVGSSGMGP